MTEEDKKIRELLKGNFEEATPSLNFTNKVMDTIRAQEVLSRQQKFEYVPVISKFGWTAIGALFLVAIYFGMSSEKGSKYMLTEYIPDLNIEYSVIHSPITLFAVLSILALLIIDRFLGKHRIG